MPHDPLDVCILELLEEYLEERESHYLMLSQFALQGCFDVDKEVARLNKQREKLEKDLAGVLGRINNKKFMDKAPPKVVAETVQQKVDAEQKVSAILEKIEQMSGMAKL